MPDTINLIQPPLASEVINPGGEPTTTTFPKPADS